MSFNFKQHESVDKGIKRIARHQIDRVIRSLARQSHTGREKAIHDARKRLKRLRALVRLVRGAMERKTFRRENGAYRDAGRPLSVMRDAAVLVTTLDNLLRHFKVRAASRAFKKARNHLQLERRELLQSSDQPALRKIVRKLHQARERIDRWKLDQSGWDALCDGLRRTHRDGRRAMNRADRKREDECLHEWRKRVKDLWHHVQLLQCAWPEELGKLADMAHDLADLLGDDHDLAVLREMLLESPDDFGDAPFVESLLGLIDARRSELQHQAISLGLKVYGEKPAAFVRRLHTYWVAWRKEEDPAASIHVS